MTRSSIDTRTTEPVLQPAVMTTVGRCFPSGRRGEPIAGDFYDVFALDEDRTLIAVGDVVGHGPGAAGRMAALRAENRAFALDSSSVVDVVRRLDVVQCARGPEELATLWLGVYDRATGWLEYTSAGHPPPVVAGHGVRAYLLAEASAPPLGSGYVAQHAAVDRVQLSAGALLVAYSDGLVERPDLDLEHQIEALRRIIEQVYAPVFSQDGLERMIKWIVRQLPQDANGAADDVCVVAVHLPLGATTSR